MSSDSDPIKRKYDLIFSLGGACSCSQALREADLQFSSFPFDWVNGSTLLGRVEMLERDFAGWLELDSLDPITVAYDGNESHWRDRVLGFGYLHDFHRGVLLRDELPGVRAKYRRRVDRLRELIDRSKRVLVVWVDVPTSPEVWLEALLDCRRRLMVKWQKADIDVLAFKCAEEVPIWNACEESSEGVRIVSFDYRDDLGSGAWMASVPLISAWIRQAGYQAVDYRSPEEKAKWKVMVRQKRYGKYGAKTYCGYCWNRLEYKLYKHFRNRMVKKHII